MSNTKHTPGPWLVNDCTRRGSDIGLYRFRISTEEGRDDATGSFLVTDECRRELLIEWLGTRKIIRLAHKHGLYARAAKARTRQRQIEAIRNAGWTM